MIPLGAATVRATRMTYVGELGWELMVPVADAAGVYDLADAEGADLGVANAGYYAIESLRLEKGYRAFGRELTPDYTPVEAGLVFATALKGDKDFLGREALEAHRDRARRGRPAAPAGLVRPGGPGADAVGRRAAAPRRSPGGPGHQRRLGRHRRRGVGLAYVRADGPVTAAWLDGAAFEVDVAGERHPVRLSLRAPLA